MFYQRMHLFSINGWISSFRIITKAHKTYELSFVKIFKYKINGMGVDITVHTQLHLLPLSSSSANGQNSLTIGRY